MTLGVHSVGVSLTVSAVSRHGLQCVVLRSTGHQQCLAEVGDSDMVGVDDIDGDMFRYRITVQGTGIEEYYEYPEAMTEQEVADDWLSDVRESWGPKVSSMMAGRVEVDKLWETQTTQDCSETQAIPLPPPETEEEQ